MNWIGLSLKLPPRNRFAGSDLTPQIANSCKKHCIVFNSSPFDTLISKLKHIITDLHKKDHTLNIHSYYMVDKSSMDFLTRWHVFFRSNDLGLCVTCFT